MELLQQQQQQQNTMLFQNVWKLAPKKLLSDIGFGR